MLAGVRNVAWGAAMAMAGFLALTLACCVWIILFLDARSIFFGPWGVFDSQPSIHGQGLLESLLALAVVIWLIAYAIRRVSRSISTRHERM
jgi:hypothetical protein